MSTPTLAGLDDLHRTRLQLELSGVQQPATREQLDRLRDAFDRLSEPSDPDRLDVAVTAGLEFHQAIVDLIGSERLSAFYRDVRAELTFYTTVLLRAAGHSTALAEPLADQHRDVYEAVRSGDHDRASMLLRAHIDDTHDRLREVLAATSTAGIVRE